ncbi:hypothetical protein HHI36_000028 [Cryptolaemus montrouzieri]|uniref:Poly(A) RNA polymerase, mitochondrial n=1 Tax=Cryptolaemus montrouzieri TaxID=559131 RepID=A0ABD2P3D5_9CUCU
MFHYTTGIEPMHFILVEFRREADVISALSSSTFIKESSIAPVNSQFLWFRASSKQFKSKNKNFALQAENGTTPASNEEIRDKLGKCDNVTHQIETLYILSKLTDLETRLRFLTARQVEMSVTGMFPHAEVLPFGSSVNGFGKMGCDLDVVLTLNEKKELAESRLVFHCKGSAGVDRSNSLRNLEAFGDLLHLFLPGCARVRKILQARVPIIKYYHQFTDVECDLSMSNVSGVHMSDFLYIMGALDSRVRPLVFAVRKWANEVGLTNSSPGRWITNFSLTLLVLSFLQGPLHSPPILPSLNTLVKSAESKDSYITEEGVNCTFLRDIGKLHHKSSNTESLEELLCGFFEYYAQFDFKSKSVCLNEAVALTKPEHSALYIVNPLERGLNVSKNVSLEELERFKIEVKNAAWILQSTEDSKLPNWGLLSLFERKNKSKLEFKLHTSRNGRLMHVKELFVEDEKDEENNEVHFQNDDVKKQVDVIKRTTKIE